MSSAGRASPAPKATRNAIIVVALSFAAFFGVATWVFRRAIPAWNTSRTYVADVPHERVRGLAAKPIARKLVWVVVDGLTYDVAASTETIAPLAAEGVLRPMSAAFPTFTAGGIAAMFTGQSPRESGVRLNGATVGTEGLDDVLHAASDVGIHVRVHTGDYAPFGELARPPERATVSAGKIAVLIDAAARSIAPDDAREIDAIHFGEVDDEGHEGGHRSPGYREAALDAGVFLQRMAATLDPTRDVLIAVSDHGHRADGGHGGVEPDVRRAFLLAWGASIKRGVELGERPLRDVASTVSVLVGASTPSSNMGAPMLDMLDVDRARRAELLAEPFEQLVAYDCAQAPDLALCADAATARSALAQGDDAEATRIVSGLSAALDARRDGVQRAGSTTRGLIALLLGAAILAIGSRVRPNRVAALAVPVVALAPYVSLLVAMGYVPTLSKMTATHVFAMDAAWAAALPMPSLAFVAVRHRLGLREVIWLEAVGLALVLPMLVWAGADSRQVFDPLAGILLFQLSPVALLTAIGGVVILAARAVQRRRERRRMADAIASSRRATSSGRRAALSARPSSSGRRPTTLGPRSLQ